MFSGFKTIAFNVVTIVAAFLAWPELLKMVDPQWVVFGQAAVNLALRFLTRTPVFK